MKFLQTLIENERFIEALYYGSLYLKKECPPELHLYLGLACCASVKPVSRFQQFLEKSAEDNNVQLGESDFKVTGNTLIVYDGFFHFIEAKRKDPAISFDESLWGIVEKVLFDLMHYLRQDFNPFAFNKNYSVRTAGYGAYILLRDFQGKKIEPGFHIKRMEKYAAALIEEVGRKNDGDAEFYSCW